MTDFSRTARESELERRTQQFIRDVVIPHERDPRQGPHGPAPDLVRELREKARAAALLAPQVSEEWGGHGLSHGETQSNPTYLLSTPRRRYVLRRKPPGALLPSAHAVDREYRVMRALADRTSVPVARPLLLCQEAAVIGTDFYVMEHVEGRIFWTRPCPRFPSRTAGPTSMP